MPNILSESVPGGYVYCPTSVFISKNVRTLEQVVTFIWLGHDHGIGNLLATIIWNTDKLVR
jgi:hypothetical protein